ncbi:MAG: multiheme c-type cytochrome [Gammaproteobacteria bacterium]|nr:multiheme c-type cytochrome [Gammaproteobacteria bacterium]
MSRLWIIGILLSGQSLAAPIDTRVHLGVASCAAGVCHGKVVKDPQSNVWLTEYTVWSTDDRHARAYQTLLTDESKTIAAKLGLPSAQGAKICLDCHADNVQTSQRGPKFQISDGVGCEACHGGAESWIETHTEPAATHQANLAEGMLATEDINVRAQVCLSCHLGTADQFATHQIMGAGHPRLRFELEAFTQNQPPHFAVDADYRERKPAPSGFEVWRAGQLQAATRYVELLNSPLYPGEGWLPDFAFYDCHACHHSMDDKRWPASRRGQGLLPGSPRLQDQHLLMIRALAEASNTAAVATLTQLTDNLLQAGQEGPEAVGRAAAGLLAWLNQQDWLKTTDDSSTATRRAIAELAAQGVLNDFAHAEQAFMGLETLSIHIGDATNLQSRLDELFGTVQQDDAFDPSKFRQAARRLLNAL